MLSAIGGTAPQYVYLYHYMYCHNGTCEGDWPAESENEEAYLLDNGEWLLDLDIGFLKGEWSCNANFQCSCIATGFKEPNGSGFTAITSPSVNKGTPYQSMASCQMNCGSLCATENDGLVQGYGLNSHTCYTENCPLGDDGCHCIEDDDDEPWEPDDEPED